MVKKKELQEKIGSEFVAGIGADEVFPAADKFGDEDFEMELSPAVAADFEAGLESTNGDACGCGCGHSCSGSGHGDELSSNCHGCHNHG